jgi:HNH endonuclease
VGTKASRPPRRDALERFAAKVAPSDENGCEMWTAGRFRRGYGQFKVGSRTDGTRRNVQAHRWIYEQRHGPIPPGLEVRHRCDRPACMADAHHLLGTRQENADDMVERCRSAHPEGSRNPASKLSEGQVAEIRRLRPRRTLRSIGVEFGVSESRVCEIVKGKTWTHV